MSFNSGLYGGKLPAIRVPSLAPLSYVSIGHCPRACQCLARALTM